MGCPLEDVQQLASRLFCKVGKMHFVYLGLPIRAKLRTTVMWDPVVQNFKRKLSMWKRSYLSLGGKVTLVKAALSNLPIYFTSLLLLLAVVRNKLDRIRREFFMERLWQ